MPNAIQGSGGQPQKPTRFEPLWSNEFWTGLWTQRSPLRDAATPYLYGKFYQASRYESLIDGLNVEISPKLTLIRRPGNSVYNSQTFANVDRFYDFRVFSGGAENIHVMVDTAAALYDGTGPSRKTLIHTKSAGAGKSSMLSVGETLYVGDGVSTYQWVQSNDVWAAAAKWTAGQFIVDTNNNVQKSLGLSATITNIAITSNVLTATFTAGATFNVGDNVAFSGLTSATFLNGLGVAVLTATSTTITATFTYAGGYASASDTGLMNNAAAKGTAGGSQPSWPTTAGAFTLDGTAGWVCRGSSVRSWGLTTPAAAPTAVNALNTSQPLWAANTFYGGATIVDTNTHVQTLTTSGTAGGSQPTWNVTVGGTTTDGTAVWANKGSATRVQNHVYALGAFISVAWTQVIYVGGGGTTRTRTSGAPGRPLPEDDPSIGDGTTSYTVNYTGFFKATQAGTSANAATSTIPWAPGIGTQVSDGTVIWANIGASVTWTTANGGGSLASLALTTATQVTDSNGGLETISIAGESGAASPVWSNTVGGTTIDHNATWVNGGNVAGANTGAWVYGFTFADSVTGDESTLSPVSSGILLAATSVIQLSGATSPDPQADLIRIYRTTQNSTAPLFRLAEIPMPSGDTWTYADTSVDLGLNQLIEAPDVEQNNPPPAGLTHLVFHLNRVFGVVGNVVSYSGGPDTLTGNGNSSFPPGNTFTFPSTVAKMWPSAYGLLVMTSSDIFIISGQGTSSSILFAAPYITGTGLLSEDCFVVNGALPYMYTADRTVVSLDAQNGLIEPGYPIGDLFRSGFDPATSYLTWLVNGDDKGLFVANSTGWFRMNPTPAPETGYTWSPLATIAGGVGAIACIETTPGNRQLLVGPASSGPILKRDLATNSDNGTPYTAFATAGSIVMAVPGQLAAPVFVATDEIAVGGPVSVSVLLGEISGEFTTLTNPVNDPPGFPAPASLYTNRWYLSSTGAAQECRHMQVKFTWGAVNAPNELLSFTLFAGFSQEQ
jgi:hypothetical protein